MTKLLFFDFEVSCSSLEMFISMFSLLIQDKSTSSGYTSGFICKLSISIISETESKSPPFTAVAVRATIGALHSSFFLQSFNRFPRNQ